MSSLDPNMVSASQFQDLILRHWEIENCLHYWHVSWAKRPIFLGGQTRREGQRLGANLDGADEYRRIADPPVVAGRTRVIARNPRTLPGKPKKNRSNSRLCMIRCGELGDGGQCTTPHDNFLLHNRWRIGYDSFIRPKLRFLA